MQLDVRWRIEMLGGLRAVQGDCVLTRFRTQKTGALFAYLAYYRQRTHLRGQLLELFWPESEPHLGRHSLSQALSWLRQRLEPHGVPAGAVLRADRETVQLNAAACVTDVVQFDAALATATRAGSDADQVLALTEAAALYGGELLPGYCEDWVLRERERLAERYLQSLHRLVVHLSETGDLQRALKYARRSVHADPLREEARCDLIRLLAAVGRPEAALRQYHELERLLKNELGSTPIAATQALARKLALLNETTTRPGRTGPSASSLPDSSARGPALPPSPPRLPRSLTRFFGRAAELARLRAMLLVEERRLITLTGPGGIGKTRLALAVAEPLVEAGYDAVWFVPLADLTDPCLIPQAVRDALPLSRAPEVEPLEQVVVALSRKRALLLLDNFDHLVEEGASAVRTLLDRTPGLTCLVTSRRRLNLAGEREFPVPPLAVPGPGDDPERLLECESVQLFADRAQAVRPEFRVAANAATVATLCAKLEGLPLALELAAARSGVFSPAQMLTHLGRRFDFLVSQQSDTAARHQTLWAAIDWSYRLLSPKLQRFLARLSVFHGGWTLVAAERVTCVEGGGPDEEARPLEYLEQLRETSLILAEESSPEMRFRLLESVREFAREQLAPEEQAALERRHEAFYLALAEEAEPYLTRADQVAWLDRLEWEQSNFRAVLGRLVEREEAEAGLRLATALRPFWQVRDYQGEGRHCLTTLLKQPGAQARTAVRARALIGAGALAGNHSDYVTARALWEESLAIGRELGDKRVIAASLSGLGTVFQDQGRYETAHSFHEESLAIGQELDDAETIAAALLGLGNAAQFRGDFEAARRFYEGSLAIKRELGDRRLVSSLLNYLGDLSVRQDDFLGAQSLYEESLAIKRELGHRGGIAASLYRLGNIAWFEENYEVAQAYFEESLAISRELGDTGGIGLALNNLARVARAQGDYKAARALLGESMRVWRQRAGLPGFGMSECLEELAGLAWGEGQAERGAKLFGAWEALFGPITAPRPAAERARYERLAASLRATLGEEAFAAAWAAGRSMSLDAAVAFALDDSSAARTLLP